ncbi:TPA: NAD(P)H-dependent oxidoreductase [Candidatus Woesearchaeota archaeon]|nr:NAD(P)H-dependent oxidoreductase [Candidatus Woesearchaeota archaeon]HIH91962.1 NAD(P)H-dependent oxidoreductase [Candidatus Woesearchaeota archaeon]HII64215.1 NAD(P)H-dependent oxidoreductase [Candidatus Woesearchaeota archaeon]HII65651.1 NAD(P)H-dependent oxidoreductase [Candidatus Woesearchaeota archaeon]HIJ18786.1 NAD(P)H-dependent oxidoreductase [Candidatus Woesearchaeota archaeon]
MEFRDIVMKRYATKKFDGRKIDQKKVDELFEIIRHAASSFGLQPWKIRVVADQATKEELAPASWNQAQITTCSHLLVFCANTDIDGLIAKYEKYMKKSGAPDDAVKAYIGMMRGWAQALDDPKRLSWSQRQTYLALGNAINGAKSLGFDSCPMEGFSPEEYGKILKLPKNIVPSALCPIGYAADKQQPKLRFAKEEIFF